MQGKGLKGVGEEEEREGKSTLTLLVSISFKPHRYMHAYGLLLRMFRGLCMCRCVWLCVCGSVCLLVITVNITERLRRSSWSSGRPISSRLHRGTMHYDNDNLYSPDQWEPVAMKKNGGARPSEEWTILGGIVRPIISIGNTRHAFDIFNLIR